MGRKSYTKEQHMESLIKRFNSSYEAEKFSVAKATIDGIAAGKSWRHINVSTL